MLPSSSWGQYSFYALEAPGNAYGAAVRGVGRSLIAVGREYGTSYRNEADALLWRNPWSAPLLLPTSGSSGAEASSVSEDGSLVAGWIYQSLSDEGRATLWHTGSSSPWAESIHPTGTSLGYDCSHIESMSPSGQHQSGWARTLLTGAIHACGWSSSELSFRDLNPQQFENSQASGVSNDGSRYVGMAQNAGQSFHALLWLEDGNAIDLNPYGTPDGYCFGISANGTKQVGMVWTAVRTHAALWSGSAESFVDLNPIGYDGSATSISPSGEYQAGSINSSLGAFAAVWHGTASSVVNLSANLPERYRSAVASSVDDSGNVFGRAFDTYANRDVACVWRSGDWLRTPPDILDILRNEEHWAAFDPWGQYFRWSGSPQLPGSCQTNWSGYFDLTRVPDGQCVAFVRSVTGAPPATKWLPAAKVVTGGSPRRNMLPGDAIATFAGGHYDSGHCAIYVRTVDDQSIEVVDQNFITGANNARAIGRHTFLRIGGSGTSNLTRYWIISRNGVNPSTARR